jgi:SPASM domain peptide maturase of grasp-with-spasm system
MKDNYLLILETAKVARGSKRGIVMDLHTGAIHLIPLTLADFMEDGHKRAVGDIYKSYPKSEHTVIDEYINWLTARQLAILLPNEGMLGNFDSLPTSWDMPHTITNCILEYAGICRRKAHFDNLLVQIDTLGIPYVELRMPGKTGMQELMGVIKAFQKTNITGLDVYVRYHKSFVKEVLESQLKFLTVLNRLVCFSVSGSLPASFGIHDDKTHVVYTPYEINAKTCGIIDAQLFMANMLLHKESLHHNTCLNRKIAIDATGEIRNCPSMATSYGNIATTSLAEAIEAPGFQKLWHIHKDQISTCKDCEFRHVCTDCRAYLSDPGDLYSKPLKCGYNPYTNEWADWSSNPLSKAAITHYGLAGG